MLVATLEVLGPIFGAWLKSLVSPPTILQCNTKSFNVDHVRSGSMHSWCFGYIPYSFAIAGPQSLLKCFGQGLY